jgi:hypothetical protein
LRYREIEETYLPVYTRHWDDHVKVPWLYNKTTKIMISYEDPQSITIKAKYVIQKHLGGMMFWDLGQDDSKSTLLERSTASLAETDSLSHCLQPRDYSLLASSLYTHYHIGIGIWLKCYVRSFGCVRGRGINNDPARVIRRG